jgi:uncharacterized protein YutE (UPF0331/DUF86 family)
MNSGIRTKVVADRVAWVRKMLDAARELPLDTRESFLSDSRTVAATESYVRRGLEGLLDLGRHILSKGFNRPVAEYKDIPVQLRAVGVLSEGEAGLMREMAGYRNRMVHFYHEVSAEELYDIRVRHLQDIEQVLEALVNWINSHPEKRDAE